MISIIILTWNSERYIKKCIDSLLSDAKASGLETEVLIFDNGSTDSTVSIVETAYSSNASIHLTKYTSNKGTTYPRNVGIAQATGEYVICIDADTETTPGALSAMIEELGKHEMPGIICPKIIFPDGSVQESIKRFPTIVTKVLRASYSLFGIFHGALVRDELYEGNVTTYPDYGISACWCMKKELFKEVGFFDEHIFYAPEDVDFCIRVWKAGYKVIFCPRAIVIHHAQRASYRKPLLALKHLAGLLYLFRKHSYFFSRAKLYRTIGR